MNGFSGNHVAIFCFTIFLFITLGITFIAARSTRSKQAFYTGGGNFSALGNGLAIAGDYMSAAALLGVSAMITKVGFFGMLYGIGFVASWPVVLLLIAERLRAMGTFTLSDALASQVSEKPIRIFAAISSLCVIAFYLIAQIVGAGEVIGLLFGIPYNVAVTIVGILITLYVCVGGMLATSLVQIVKAVLLLVGTLLVVFLTFLHFGFSLSKIITDAVAMSPLHTKLLTPGVLHSAPLSGISLGLALMFGTSGLPHILMRFFTVPDVKTARMSVFYACLFNGIFFLMIFVIGFASVSLVGGNAAFHLPDGALRGGANMTAIYLSYSVGGSALMGFVSAVAFATILAVIAGLTLSGASTISHDIFARVLGNRDEKTELRISRLATISIGVITILLGLVFQKQNVAYMVGLAFAIAASANFPLLFLVMGWKRITTAGAILGGIAGLSTAILLTILGPSIWVSVLGFKTAIFPYSSPTFIAMPLAFITTIIISRLTQKKQENIPSQICAIYTDSPKI